MNTSQTKCESDDNNESFLAYFRQSNILPPSEWPQNSHLLVTASARAPYVNYYQILKSNMDESDCKSNTKEIEIKYNIANNFRLKPLHNLPLNGEKVYFDGQLFKGIIISRIKEVPEPSEDSWNALNTERVPRYGINQIDLYLLLLHIF